MKIGGYEILGPVGRGGMGTVFRARGRDGKVVAIKVLHPTGDHSRFAREGRLLASLGESEGFVPLVDSGEFADATGTRSPYIVMPFVEGGTLRARLEEGPLPVPEVVALAKDLARALARAHERGIVHRDLKPENVLFAPGGKALVADLGLAKHFSSSDDAALRSAALSRTGEALGTPGYMPIEQIEDAKSAQPSVDVFALGAILYECLAGAPAFEGESAVEVIAHMEGGSRRSLEEACPKAPSWLIAVVEKALARDPRRRFADAGELLAALERREAPEGRGLLLVAVAVVALAATVGVLALRRPAPVRPAVSIPEVYKPLQACTFLELRGVWGSPSGKHASLIETVGWTPDGKHVLSGACDDLLRQWDATSAAEERVYAGHQAAIRRFAFAPDGASFLSAGYDNTLILWDARTGEKKRTIGPLDGYILAIAALPDGKRWLAAGMQGEIATWDAESGLSLDKLATGYKDRVVSLALSPDGKTVAVAGDREWVEVWSLAEKKLVYRLEAKSVATAVAFAPDGRRVVFGSEGGLVRCFDLEADGFRWTGEHGAKVESVAVSPDGKLAASAGDGKTVVLWDLATGATVAAIDAECAAKITAVAFSPDSTRLAVGVGDAVRVFAVGEKPRSLWEPEGHRGAVTAVAISRDGTRVASGGQDGAVKIRDAVTGALVRSIATTGAVRALAFSPDAKRLIAGSGDTVRVYEAATGRETKAGLGHSHGIEGVAFLDERRFVSAGREGTVRVWEADSGRTLVKIVADQKWLDAIEVDPERKTVLTGGQDGIARRFDLETGNLLESYDAHGESILALGSDPASGRLVVAAQDEVVKVWDTATRAVRLTAPRGKNDTFLRGLAVLPPRFLVTRDRGPSRIHDLETGEIVDAIPFEPRIDLPTSLAVSADRRVLVVGTGRGVVLRFDRRD
ncbi:MAG TPA: serine/threonine-protein kinase [Planctomycetota bacterium]|nr:serine/threonine-protein kinase [Planctomycetota bacterium]